MCTSSQRSQGPTSTEKPDESGAACAVVTAGYETSELFRSQFPKGLGDWPDKL